MKQLFIGILAASTLAFTACNGNSGKQTGAADHDHEHDHGTHQAGEPAAGMAPAQEGTFSELFAHYGHLTYALSSDDDKEAANASRGILEALPKVKTDGFTADQQKVYEDLAADIKENAGHISENVGNIEHQREHLMVLSKDFYEIKKMFGTEKPMYKMFCPMADNNAGAYWLSETKKVENPYFGAKMLTCGKVEEELN